MEKAKKILSILIPIIWIIFGLALYFLQINNSEGACKFVKGCLKIGAKNYSVGLNVNHLYYLDSIKVAFGFGPEKSYQPGPILYIVIGIAFLYMANMLYERIVEKKKKLSLNLTAFNILLIFTLLFFIVYNRWTSFYDLEQPIKYTSIFLKFPTIILSISTIALITLSTGSSILRRLLEKEFQDYDRGFKALSSFTVGSAVLIFLFYFMAMIGVYKFIPITILFSLILAFSHKEFWFWIKGFFTTKIKIETEYLSVPVLLSFVFIIILAHNFLELIRPIPIGFDDLSVYITNAKAMAETGRLLNGAMSYYWELFYCLGFILFKSVTIVLMISVLVGLFSSIAIFKLTQDYCRERNFEKKELIVYPTLAAVLFYSLPIIIFQSSSDLKVDLASFMFTTTAFIYFLRWRRSYLVNKTNNVELYITAILAGFGFAIKYTNIIFLFILLLYLIFIIYSKHKFSFKKYLIAGIFLILSLIPVSPISIRNIIQAHSLSLSSIRFGKTDDKIIRIDPPFEKEVKEPNYKKYMQNYRTEDREELGRYMGYEKSLFKKYLLLPLRISSNTLSHGIYVDISYMFIIFVPLSYLSYLYIKKKKEEKNKNNPLILKEILLVTLLFWVIWLFIASGVIWYGLAGLALLIILVIEGIRCLKNNSKILSIVVTSLIVVWFVLSLFLKTAFLPDHEIYLDSFGLKFARGDLDKNSYVDARFTTYAEIIKNINKDIDSHPDNPPKIYRVGTFYKYFISNSGETVIDDLLLEKFTYAAQDDNYDKILQRFKNSGIKYLIVDKSMYEFDKTPEQSLKIKTTKLINFVNNKNLNFKLLTDPKDQKVFIAEIK